MKGLLSFPGDMEPLDLEPLNVLIGPNGSGKTNVIEVFELLRATSTGFAGTISVGGGVSEWLWKGEGSSRTASIDIETGGPDNGLETPTNRPLRYKLEFTSVNSRVEVCDEAIEEKEPLPGHDEPYFYYRFQSGLPVLNIKKIDEQHDGGTEGDPGSGRTTRQLRRDSLKPVESVLSQRSDPELYPELTWIGEKFGQIQTFRDWTFGRDTPVRQSQPADIQESELLRDSSNLALLLNQLEHHDPQRFNDLLKRFYPRFERMSTLISVGRVQFYLHEAGLISATPATRLSDGTMRFIAILAILLAPEPPPVACIEEPELGLHPDAVALVGELLVEASQRMQLIVTTHSDALVSALSSVPQSVIACERPGSGTILRRLDPERLSHWLDDYRLGDVWRMGELGANP